jgi:uncharacterized SAM-binding protein YcdF (DUF218 family)
MGILWQKYRDQMIKLILRIFTLVISLWLIGFLVYFAAISRIVPYTGDAEGIVVFTGGERRVEKGLELLEQKRADHLLISGVNPKVKKSEILAVNHEDEDLAAKIDLGFSAQDTLGNADEAAQWVRHNQLQSLIVVTSNYHMPRALVHLGAELPDVALYPYPVVPAVFGERMWFLHGAPWHMIFTDYNKFLFTYPKILLLNRGK